MKTYTAIYTTPSIENCQYSFKANNMEDAKRYCENYFNVPVSKIVCNEIEHKFYGKIFIESIDVLTENTLDYAFKFTKNGQIYVLIESISENEIIKDEN